MKQYTVLPQPDEKPVLGIFTRDRSFYKTFFPLLFVITLQQLAALAVNMADNIMLGRYSELALSGATLVNQVQFTLQQITAGTGAGIVALASQYWGQGRTEPIKKIINIGIKFSLLFGVIFFITTLITPEGVLSILTSDKEVIAEGMKYLKIMCWTYLIFSVSSSLMYSLQSVETASVGTVMSISTLCINVCLNYCFIYGNFGAPELGVVGAAIATLVSRIVELIIIVVYVLFIDKKLKAKLFELVRFDFTYLRDYMKVATPIVISGLMWGIAQAAQTAVLGHMSAAAIAANSISSVIFMIFAVVGMSAANAGCVTVAKAVGAGRLTKIKVYARTLQALFLIFGILSGVLMFIFKDIIVSFYSISEEAKRLSLQFITVLCVTTVGSCYEYPVEGGIIAGGGDTKYQAYVDNLFMWLFTIPSAALSAFVFKFPPIVTFCCLKADQLLKCIPNSIHCNRFRWVKILTRE